MSTNPLHNITPGAFASYYSSLINGSNTAGNQATFNASDLRQLADSLERGTDFTDSERGAIAALCNVLL